MPARRFFRQKMLKNLSFLIQYGMYLPSGWNPLACKFKKKSLHFKEVVLLYSCSQQGQRCSHSWGHLLLFCGGYQKTVCAMDKGGEKMNYRFLRRRVCGYALLVTDTGYTQEQRRNEV